MNAIDYFFDVNCAVGEWPYYELRFSTVAGLRREMRRAGIRKAVVSGFESSRYRPVPGNQKLRKQLAGCPGLYPCYEVMPLVAGEFGYRDTAALLAELKEHEIKFVRMHPTRYVYSLAGWCAGELLGGLEHAGIPLLIDYDDLGGGCDTIYNLCSTYPLLNLIILNFRHMRNRPLFQLLKQFDHLYLDFSFLMLFREIEGIVERFGARHLLFGSNMPFYDPDRVVGRLLYSDLSPNDKRAIAHGNIEKMIAEIGY